MVKSLTTALAIGAFSMTGFAGQALAQQPYSRCVKAPKDYIPCAYVAQTPTPQPKYFASSKLPKQKNK